MKEAGRLMRAGMPRKDAMKAAWASAKAALLFDAPRQQEAGLRAALRRYGVNPDRIAERAREAVHAVVAAIDAKRPALLPSPLVKSIDLKRGADGVYRL